MTWRAQDVYSEVAAVVARIVEEDAAADVKEAIALRGVIDRKLVKQTVMTSVYGVTQQGAVDQIAARLLERGWTPGYKLNRTAAYAAKVSERAQEGSVITVDLGCVWCRPSDMLLPQHAA